jgi:hypothetical protein
LYKEVKIYHFFKEKFRAGFEGTNQEPVERIKQGIQEWDTPSKNEEIYVPALRMKKHFPPSHFNHSGPLQGTRAGLKFFGSFTISNIEFFSKHHNDSIMPVIEGF